MKLLFVLGEDVEDAGEGGQRRGQLVLQHVPVLLLQGAARQLPLDELHHRLQLRIGSRHPQDDGVPVTKPGAGAKGSVNPFKRIDSQFKILSGNFQPVL